VVDTIEPHRFEERLIKRGYGCAEMTGLSLWGQKNGLLEVDSSRVQVPPRFGGLAVIWAISSHASAFFGQNSSCGGKTAKRAILLENTTCASAGKWRFHRLEREAFSYQGRSDLRAAVRRFLGQVLRRFGGCGEEEDRHICAAWAS